MSDTGTYIYDPNKPPPAKIEISLKEYDEIKKAIAELFDCHRFIDDLARVIRNEVTEEERQDILVGLVHWQHLRKFT